MNRRSFFARMFGAASVAVAVRLDPAALVVPRRPFNLTPLPVTAPTITDGEWLAAWVKRRAANYDSGNMPRGPDYNAADSGRASRYVNLDDSPGEEVEADTRGLFEAPRYMRQLQALDEPLRTQLLTGDFR